MASVKGRSLELYFIDGRPDGMLTAEVFNWTGHVLVAPRTQIAEALKRQEASYTCAYLLLGYKEDGTPLGYIGETEDLPARVRKHDLDRDWWDTLVVITSSANQLNKAHIRYIEARLIEEALFVGRLRLDNTAKPGAAGLSEAATANMEAFLEQLFLVLPAVRIDYFLKQTRPTKEKSAAQEHVGSPLFEFKISRGEQQVHATARLIEGEFVVQKGSQARSEWSSSAHSYKNLYDELVSSGVLVDRGTYREFTESYAFRSPSAAGAVVAGRTSNGRVEWKIVGQSTTYGQWEEERLETSKSGDEQ